MDKEQFKRVKLEAIANNIKEAANSIAEALKELPKGKAYKNVFVKTYKRRPMSKQKTKSAKYKLAINTAYYVIQHKIIASQPFPNYERGGEHQNKIEYIERGSLK